MIVSIIAAVAKNNVIGKDNNLIWHLPKDMKFFMNTTLNHNIIMGRKNFESIPHKFSPLKNRTNIIVTRNNKLKIASCIVVKSIEDGIAYAKKNGETECFIIGGGQIYKLALGNDLVDRMYITHIEKEFDGDTFFPNIDYNLWESTELFINKADEKNTIDFAVMRYDRLVVS